MGSKVSQAGFGIDSDVSVPAGSFSSGPYMASVSILMNSGVKLLANVLKHLMTPCDIPSMDITGDPT